MGVLKKGEGKGKVRRESKGGTWSVRWVGENLRPFLVFRALIGPGIRGTKAKREARAVRFRARVHGCAQKGGGEGEGSEGSL